MPVRRSRELEELQREAGLARDRGDDGWFRERVASGDVVAFGSAPGEVTRGRDEFQATSTVEAERRELEAAGIEFRPGELEGYEFGDAGWTIREQRIELADGSYVPARSVTIFVREGGEWKRAASFLSVLVENELLAPGSPLARRGTNGRSP